MNNIYEIIYYWFEDESGSIKFRTIGLYDNEDKARKIFNQYIRLSGYGWYRLYKLGEI